MSPYIKDKTGQKFGRLTVLGLFGRTKAKQAIWECQCECGGQCFLRTGDLKSGNTASCGCLKRETVAAKNLIHGDATRTSKPSEYTTWQGIKARCYNPKSIVWKHYGGRGIQLSEEWKMSYEAFLRDMGRKPSPKHTIDRIDPDGNYCKENCRWATWSEQNMNKRNRSVNRLPPGKWSKSFDYCIKCGSAQSKHAAHGVCVNCYAIRYR